MAPTASVVTLEEVSVLVLPRPEATTSPRVVLVGGVPGAGKTTAIAQLSAAFPSINALDPEFDTRWRPGCRAGRVPALVHILHAPRRRRSRCADPFPGRTRYDPATRPRRRRWFVHGWPDCAAGTRCWSTSTCPSAGRDRAGAPWAVVDPVRFAGHWARWEALRTEFVGTPGRLDGALWSDVVLTDRERVAADLRRLVAPAYLPMR